MARVEWLGDAIEEWRTHGPTRFSSQTWKSAYEPTFRVVREILANTRRDVSIRTGRFTRPYSIPGSAISLASTSTT